MADFLKGGAFDKYFVLKTNDIERYLSQYASGYLYNLGEQIEKARWDNESKFPNRYLVVNVDEPYAPEIVEILKRNGHWG